MNASFVGLCVWLSPIAHADIYRWTDAAGRVNVTNITPPEAALEEPTCRDPNNRAGQPVDGTIEPVMQEPSREPQGH